MAALEQAVAHGLTIHELSPDERAAWQRQTAHLPGLLIKKISRQAKELYDIILKGKAAFAARAAED